MMDKLVLTQRFNYVSPKPTLHSVVRSYLGYYTGSHQNSAVKRLWAGIVLGWVTSREVPVSHPHSFCSFSYLNTLSEKKYTSV